MNNSNKLLKFCGKSIRHLRLVLRDTNHDYIRIGIQSGGCNGLKYNIIPSSEVPHKNDIQINEAGVNIHICGKSLLFLIGTEVHWVNDIFGSRIEFKNPNAITSCGCGETFSVKK